MAETRNAMTLDGVEVKVGQLFVTLLHPEGRLQDAMRGHRENHYGGVFLGRDNLRSVDQVRRLTHRFRAHTREIPPLLVATDEEGGMVSSSGHITAPAPSAACLGVINDPEVTQDVYLGLGEKLRALGFNAVFAPVLDVNVESANPVIGTRSFGTDPELVARHAAAALAGLADAGIASSVKHFPGHGATRLDSHLTLPVVRDDGETLRRRELMPFRRILDGDSPPDMVMTAHVAYPALEKGGVPATLSTAILRDLLRRELGYAGLVVTDSMEMQGITERFGPERAAVEAIEAGADLILYAADPEMAAAAYRGLVKAVKAGKVSEERIDISLDRVLRLRRGFKGQKWYTEDELPEVMDYRHDPAFFQAASAGLTLEGNAGVLKEIAAAAGPKVAVFPRELDPPRPLPLAVVREQLEPAGFTVIEVSAAPTSEEIAAAERAAAEAGVVVVATASRGEMTAERKALVQALTRRDVIKVGVALLDPGDAEAMMTANCRIKTWGFNAVHLWALCQRLLG